MRGEDPLSMIALTEAQARQIRAEAAAGYPNEICGFLIGSVSRAQKIVTQLLPLANAWEAVGETFAELGADFMTGSQRRRFAIPPDAFYQADKSARAEGRDILGFYHSHPDDFAVPSEYDLRLAQQIFPGYSYMIVAVPGGAPDGVINVVGFDRRQRTIRERTSRDRITGFLFHVGGGR